VRTGDQDKGGHRPTPPLDNAQGRSEQAYAEAGRTCASDVDWREEAEAEQRAGEVKEALE
jgi:hypothetical protein